MHDISQRSEPPSDWQQALAALPLESPPPDGWNRIAGRLPARARPSGRRRRWPVTLAAAATLAAMAIVPVLWRSPPEPATPMAATPAAAPVHPQTSLPTSESSTAVAGETSSAATANRTDTADASAISTTAVATTAKAVEPSVPRSKRDTAADTAATASASLPSAAPPTLESLYVESAHLESLLVQIQDERVVTGPAMAMADALEDRIAAIDHALSQAGTDDIQQRELWQQRVDALRQLAGLEGTQRWLAASGSTGSDGSRIY